MKNDSLIKRQLYKVAALLIPDSLFVRLKFRKAMGRWPDLKNPRTFNEKLNWLKLHDHNSLYTRMVDKYEAKKYVAGIIGEEYIIPTYGVWDKSEDIDFDSLPDKFVMKATHDSGRVIICHDKSSLDREWSRVEMKKSLQRDFYAVTREWPYKNVPHRIIAEKFMQQSDGNLTDYKFFCFDGTVDCVMVCVERQSGNPKFYFFDRHWNFVRLNRRGMEVPEGFTLPKPQNIDKMFAMASDLSKGHPFLRVDLYNIDGAIYFSELTFFPDGGVDSNLLPETDAGWGGLLKLNI